MDIGKSVRDEIYWGPERKKFFWCVTRTVKNLISPPLWQSIWKTMRPQLFRSTRIPTKKNVEDDYR